MFLDDGVSRSSAPMHLPQHENTGKAPDGDAKSEYREVRVDQVSYRALTQWKCSTVID